MGNGNIKGITIQIDADMQKFDASLKGSEGKSAQLQKALKGIQDKSMDLQKELKQISKLLKFDPQSVEMLSQKQRVLAEAIESTKDKLEILKKAQQQMQAKGVDESSAQYRGLQREISDTEITLKRLESQQQAASNSSKEHADAVAANKAKQEELNASIAKTEQELALERAEYERDISAMQQNKNAQEQLQRARQKLTNQIGSQEQKVQLLKQKLEALTNAENKNAQEILETKTALAQAKGELNNYRNQLRRTEEQLNGFRQAARHLTGVGTAMKNAGMAMAPVSAAVAGVGAAAAKVGMDFDTAMAKVSAISGTTGDELEALRNKAKEMGETTKFSATESAQALTYMSMAGWKSEQMLDGIEGIMNLAAASGEDLAEVSDIVTDALTAFGLSAEDSAHFSDVLAAASSNSNTNVAMLGESFKYCAPLAGAYGFSVEDTALMLGLMANSGIKASQSGTAMRKILAELSSDMKIVQANGKEVTISTSNLDGSMRSLTDIIQDARTAFNGMSDAQKQAAESDLKTTCEELGIALADENGQLKTTAQLYEEVTQAAEGLTAAGKVQEAESIAGKTAMAGLLSIMNTSEEDFNKLSTAINNCQGETKRMAEAMIDNLGGDLTLLKSKLEGAGITIAEIMTPVLRDIIEQLSGVIDWFQSLDDGMKKTIVTMGAIVAAAAPMLLIGGTITKALGKMVTLLLDATSATGGLTKAFAFFSANPSVLAITGIVAALGIFIKYCYDSKQAVDELNNKMIETIKLKNDMSASNEAAIESMKNERAQLSAQIMEYDNLNAQIEKTKNKINDLRAQGVTDADQYIEIETLKVELEDLGIAVDECGEKIKESYGSIENGRGTLEAYTQRIQNAKEATALLKNITDPTARAVAEEALNLKTASSQARSLWQEYDILAQKTNKTGAEAELMKKLQTELIGIMGDSVAAYNEETQQLEINKTAILSEITVTDRLSAAKLQCVNAFNAGGAERVRAQRDETQKVITLLQAELRSLISASSAFGAEIKKMESTPILKPIADSMKLSHQAAIRQQQETLKEMDSFLAEISKVEAAAGGADMSSAFEGAQAAAEGAGKAAGGAAKAAKEEKDAVEEAIKAYEDKQKMGEMTLDEELQALAEIKARNSDTAEHIVKINEFAQQKLIDNINQRKAQNEMTAAEEIALYQQAKEDYCISMADKQKFDELINAAILEDVKALTDSKEEMSKEELQNYQEKLREKKELYKDDKEAVKEIDAAILESRKEAYEMEVEELKTAVDAMIAERQRLYKAETDGIDSKLQEELDGYQAQLDAMDAEDAERSRKQKDEKYKEQLEELRKQLMQEEDPEKYAEITKNLNEKELEYTDWLRDEKRKREREDIKEQMKQAKDEAKKAKDEAETKYDIEMEQIELFMKEESEKLLQRQQNANLTEQEITKLAKKQLKQRELDLAESIRKQEAAFRQMVDNLKAMQSEVTTGGLEGMDGSHAQGLWSVPFDGYKAILHRGETVLKKADAERWREGKSSNAQSYNSGGKAVTMNVTQNIYTPSTDVREQQRQARREMIRAGQSVKVW